jgi:hypothetical protein
MHLILESVVCRPKQFFQQATGPPVRRNAPNEKNLPQFGFCVKHSAAKSSSIRAKIKTLSIANSGNDPQDGQDAQTPNPKSYTRLPKSYWTNGIPVQHCARKNGIP